MARIQDETVREAETEGPSSALVGPVKLHIMGKGGFDSVELPVSGRVVIGRGEDCDIVLDDPSVSRRHAVLTVDRVVRVEDANSANGTRVRGYKLEAGAARDVLPGEAIEVGAWTLAISFGAGNLAPRIWPRAYFKECVAAECERVKESEGDVVVARIRMRQVPDRDQIASVLAADLRVNELVAEGAEPNEMLLLLLDRTPEVAGAIVRSLSDRLAELGLDGLEIGTARGSKDGFDADTLLRSASAEAGGPSGATAEGIVVRAPAMQELATLVQRVASGNISVLIVGETGVGKEVTAAEIHRQSARAAGPFVRLNCAALPETLLESELFGYEKGAFTGALRPKKGLLEAASGGTLFLDEVGDMPLPVQIKLLRVLEEREVLRVGALAPTKIDVRVLSATNKNLEEEVAKGSFREDFYFRLAGITLAVPPLRERREEILPLAELFAKQLTERDGFGAVPSISGQVVSLLENYAWPGNIRELKNVIERAVTLSVEGEIAPEHLPRERFRAEVASSGPDDDEQSGDALSGKMAAFERDKIIEALEACGGNQTLAAQKLGIARRTLINRLDAYGIERPRKGKKHKR